MRCHIFPCGRRAIFDVSYDLKARPVGTCTRHLAQTVRYVMSWPDAGDFILVGEIGKPASSRKPS